MSFFHTFLFGIIHRFTGVFDKFMGSDAGKQLEAAIVAFIKTDVGKITLDAVEYASALPAGTASTELRAAALAKLKTDLAAAGHDVAVIGTATLNLGIEMAFTYVSKTVAASALVGATKA